MMIVTGSFKMTEDFIRGVALVITIYAALVLTTALWLMI